jgi:HK97 family phage portal protein
MASVLERMLGIDRRSGDTSGLANPAEWLSVLMGAGPTRSKISITPATALGIATVYACVRVISEDLAKIPLEVLEDLGPDQSKPANAHPAYRLLNIDPNPEMDGMILRETVTAQMLLWGNGYAEIVRNGAGVPTQVWPLMSSQCTPVRVYDTAGAWGRLVYNYQDPEGRRGPPPRMSCT